MKVFVFDASRCNGCHGCQIACKDEHCDNTWLPYAKPQPETGHFWCKLDETTHGQVPFVSVEYNVKMCNHCADAPCIAAHPEAVYRRDDGLVVVDPEKAQDKKDLVDSCPYGAIYWNEELSLPQKCTGCAHLVDEGEKPRCVDFCQTGGLRFGEYEEFADELGDAVVRMRDGSFGPVRESQDEPHVYYVNMPKLFLAGNVWDPEPNEIVEGATVELRDRTGSIVATQKTDYFGDFKFERLDAGTYSLAIEAEGYQPVARDGIALEKSLNVGDFPLRR